MKLTKIYFLALFLSLTVLSTNAGTDNPTIYSDPKGVPISSVFSMGVNGKPFWVSNIENGTKITMYNIFGQAECSQRQFQQIFFDTKIFQVGDYFWKPQPEESEVIYIY